MLATHLRRHRGLQVGEETTELLEDDLCLDLSCPRYWQSRPRSAAATCRPAAPRRCEITTGEVYPIVESIVRRIALLVKDTLTELRPEVAADIYDRGVILTGGGALLDGIDQYMRSFINLPVSVSDEPRYATVNGPRENVRRPQTARKSHPQRTERPPKRRSPVRSLNFPSRPARYAFPQPG